MGLKCRQTRFDALRFLVVICINLFSIFEEWRGGRQQNTAVGETATQTPDIQIDCQKERTSFVSLSPELFEITCRSGKETKLN